MHVQPPVSVVCAIIVRGDRVLLAQRPPDKKLGGLWEFPGGKVERGESAGAALHRELLEELGCEVRVLQTLPAVTHEYPWCIVEMVPFVCELTADSPEPHPHEHTGLVWVERSRLAGYPLAPADVPLLTFLA